VKSRTTRQFRTQLAALPPDIRKQAYKQYRLFTQEPWHNSLQFKQVHPKLPVYSARVSKGYRAIRKRDETGVMWFWIGTQNEYDKLLSQM
jgi:hypothetical protein